MKLKIEMDDIVLLNNPKYKQNLDENIIRNINEFRGTKFRGVSKNGKRSWQILSMMEGKKVYLASVNNIMSAAIIHDFLTIQNKGLKSKTNFIYTKADLLAILNLNSLITLWSKLVVYDLLTLYQFLHKLQFEIIL